MAIAFVQAPAAATGSSGTTLALAFGSNVTAGSMLCAHVYANHGVSGVADSRSQTYTAAVSVTDGATYTLATYYFLNTTGGAVIATDDDLTAHHQYVKVEWGGDGTLLKAYAVTNGQTVRLPISLVEIT